VILDNGYFGAGSSINQEAFDYLRQAGVQVHWSSNKRSIRIGMGSKRLRKTATIWFGARIREINFLR
jgi:hypothetical protein